LFFKFKTQSGVDFTNSPTLGFGGWLHIYVQGFCILNYCHPQTRDPGYCSVLDRSTQSRPVPLNGVCMTETVLQCFHTAHKSGISPSYLADDCRLVADARERRLRSTASRTCVVTPTYSTFGDSAFAAAAGPGLWNSLPSHLKEADLSYNRFRPC